MIVSVPSAAGRLRTPGAARGSTKARVTIVTADFPGAARWRDVLLRKHFAVTIMHAERLAHLLAIPDLADVMLLDLSGADFDAQAICRRLRAAGIAQPILVLHPRGTLEDLLAGFDAGADAYIRGWFEPETVLGQLGALTARSLPEAQPAPLRNSYR